VSVSFGANVGWFPLGPREVYVPGYRYSRRYLHNVNYTNTVIVNNVIINRVYTNRSTYIPYNYRNERDAITVTSRDAFVGARPVSNHIVRVRDSEIREWRTHNAAPAIAPERVSALGARWNDTAARTAVRTPAQRIVERDVVVRRTPPSQRVTFEQERRAIVENDNRPVARRQITVAPRGATQPSDDRQRRVPDQSGNDVRQGGTPRTEAARSSERRNEVQRQNAPVQSESRTQSRQRELAPQIDTQRNDAPRNQAPRIDRSQRNQSQTDQAQRERAQETPRSSGEVRGSQREIYRAPNAGRQDGAQPAVRESYQRREAVERSQPSRQSSPEPTQRSAPQRVESQRYEAPRAESRRYEAPESSGNSGRENRQRGRDDSRASER